MVPMSWERKPYTISTDPSRIDFRRVHAFLSNSYWANGIPIETVGKSIRNSLCFGVFIQEEQVGFARVVSDFSTFAYLGDVYVEPAHRGKGLSKWLMECVLSHPELQGLRRICLGTRDAHGLYKKFGFRVSEKPENWMEIKVADVYSSGR